VINPPLGAITYADGTEFKQPVIVQSSNGWTYKPDSLRTEKEIRQGKNKVWPRGEGSYDATNWYWDDIEAHFTETNWKVPLHVDQRIGTPHQSYGDSLCVAWYTKLWGWLVLSLVVNQGNSSLTYELGLPKVAKMLLSKEIDRHDRGHMGKVYMKYEVQAINPANRVKAFMNDPWVQFTQHNESLEWDEVLGTPPDIGDQPFKKDDEDFGAYDRHNTTPVGEVRSSSGDNGLFYRKGVVEKILQSHHNWEALNELFNALQFVGFEIRPQFTYNYLAPRDRTLIGLTIEIPGQDGTDEHTVHMNAANPQVNVVCGFQRNEDKWVDRKKRQAQEQMAELTQDLAAIEYTIDL